MHGQDRSRVARRLTTNRDNYSLQEIDAQDGEVVANKTNRRGLPPDPFPLKSSSDAIPRFPSVSALFCRDAVIDHVRLDSLDPAGALRIAPKARITGSDLRLTLLHVEATRIGAVVSDLVGCDSRVLAFSCVRHFTSNGLTDARPT